MHPLPVRFNAWDRHSEDFDLEHCLNSLSIAIKINFLFGICVGINYILCSNFFSSPAVCLFFVFLPVYYVTAYALAVDVRRWIVASSTQHRKS